jgi:hypothetical protein
MRGSFGRLPAVTTDAKSVAPIDARKKKKQSVAAMQRELAALSAPPEDSEKPPVNLRKSFVRVGLVLAAVWVAALLSAPMVVHPDRRRGRAHGGGHRPWFLGGSLRQ